MSRQFDDWMFERERKKDALLDVPKIVESNTEMLCLLEEEICNAKSKIEQLQLAHEDSQQWKSKIREYVLGGIVGGLIGIVFSRLLM